MSIKSYAVIGGGLVGAACAYRLQRAGFDVTLIDPGDKRRGASFGNIGHIAPEQIDPLASPDMVRGAMRRLYAFGGPLDFRWRDAPLIAPWVWRFLRASGPSQFQSGRAALRALLKDALPAWLKLMDEIGQANLIRASGHAIVWMTREGAASWRAGDFGSASTRAMEADELDAYRDVMAKAPVAGVMFSGTGQVRSPQAVRDAIVRRFSDAGGKSIAASANSVSADETGARVVIGTGDVLEADGLVVCAGAWSAPLMAHLGVTAPLIGERGYSVQSAKHNWPETLPLTVFEERALVVSRFNDGLRASSFVEFGSPSAAPDARKWRVIEVRLRELGIAFDEQPDRWMGARPTLPDYLPAIGRLKRTPRVLYAFGHQHLGLTLAARSAELIENLACGDAGKLELAPFRIERFLPRV